MQEIRKIWVSSSLGQKDPLEKGNGNPLQYPCLGNSMGRGAWQATVHRVAKVRHSIATRQQQPHTPQIKSKNWNTCISLFRVAFFTIVKRWKGQCKSLNCVWLFATPWTIQTVEFSRPEYWSGKPIPSPGDLPNPGIKPRSPALQADSVPAEPQGKPKNTGVVSLSLLQEIFLT